MRPLLGYSDLFAEHRSLKELIPLLQQYPVDQWLSFLSRIQNVIAGDRINYMDAQCEVIEGIFSERACDALKK
jgi:hypothetical protein